MKIITVIYSIIVILLFIFLPAKQAFGQTILIGTVYIVLWLFKKETHKKENENNLYKNWKNENT